MLTEKPRLCLLSILSCFSYLFQENIVWHKSTEVMWSLPNRCLLCCHWLGTGGSWRKSPWRILCVPPIASLLFLQCYIKLCTVFSVSEVSLDISSLFRPMVMQYSPVLALLLILPLTVSFFVNLCISAFFLFPVLFLQFSLPLFLLPLIL